MGQGVDGRCGRHAQSGPAAGSFGAQLVENEDGSFYMDEQALLAYDEPYESLKNAA